MYDKVTANTASWFSQCFENLTGHRMHVKGHLDSNMDPRDASASKNTSFSPILVDTNLSYLTLNGPERQTVDTRSTAGVPMKTLGYNAKWGHRPKTVIVTENQSRNGSKSLRQFWSNRFETNRTWSPNIGAHVLFVSKRSDQNWRRDFFSATAHLRHDKCRNEGQLRPAVKTPYTPFPYKFWAVWTWGFTTYHKKYTIPIKKNAIEWSLLPFENHIEVLWHLDFFRSRGEASLVL